MAQTVDNKKTLDTGFAKFFASVEKQIIVSLHWAAVELVHLALANREYTGFTGNTQTSYTCGIFLNGKLVDVVDSQSSQSKPVRKKLKKGEGVYLDHPYEGNPRFRTGEVDVDGKYGADTALKFINGYKAPKKGIALVMTTGTEYSEFLETMHGLDVLTNTRKDLLSVMNKNWRLIP